MACDRIDTLRVRTAPLVAVCLACDAVWDASTIGILGSHIQLAMADPIEPSDSREATPA